MTYAELLKLVTSTDEQLDRAGRCYTLGDRYVARVYFPGIGRARQLGIDLDPAQLIAHLRILEHFPASEAASEGFDEVDVNDLSPSLIVKFAEIKGLVDSWKAGAFAELPASTAPAPTHRRRLARYRRE